MFRNANSQNLTVADQECDLGYVRNAYQMPNLQHALVNSFGFGGKNVVLALAKVEIFRKPVS